MFSRRIAEALPAELRPYAEPVADERRPGVVDAAIRPDLQAVMTEQAGVLRSAGGLTTALDELARLADKPGEIGTRAWEATNLLTISTALAEAARLREETRGSHWREDFPARDDVHWAGHVDARLTDGWARPRVPSVPAVGRRRSMKFTPFEELPGALVEELEAAGLDPRAVYDHVVRSLEEDLPDGGDDLTSAATIPAQTRGVADFQAREEGVVAGLGVAALVFACVLGDDAELSERVADGSHVGVGDVVLSVSGPIRGLLTAERTALNYASHLSGVATATSRWVAELEGLKARVLDTRKTLPGLRALQKYAVRCGGGVNHRSSLTEMTMVKDNHVLAAGGVVPAFEAVLEAHPGVPVEVEVTDLDQLRELLDAGCERILLDNMTDDQMAEAVQITDGHATLEASGGLTLERARDVAETGVDFISVGALTHSAVVFDLGMDLRES